jgi:hypothetical protein
MQYTCNYATCIWNLKFTDIGTFVAARRVQFANWFERNKTEEGAIYVAGR